MLGNELSISIIAFVGSYSLDRAFLCVPFDVRESAKHISGINDVVAGCICSF